MPYSQILLTAGISSLTDQNILGQALRKDSTPLVFVPGSLTPQTKLPFEELLPVCKEFIARELSGHEAIDPRRVSAEFSMLQALKTQSQGLAKGAHIHLIHTPSLIARLAVELQIPLIEQHFLCSVQTHQLAVPFDPSIPGGLAKASGAFIDQICRLLKYANPHHTAFAPIGGYKSMVALGHTAASFLGFPSYYIHEDSQVLQSLAPVPISIDDATRKTISPVAHQVGNGISWDQLAPEDQSIVETYPGFFNRVDDLLELNELGYFLNLNETEIYLSPQANVALSEEKQILNAQLKQLRELAITNLEHPGINHDWTNVPGRTHAWRIAQMGDGKRFAWQWIEGKIYVFRIWRNHSDYDREAKHIIQTTVPTADLTTWHEHP